MRVSGGIASKNEGGRRGARGAKRRERSAALSFPCVALYRKRSVEKSFPSASPPPSHRPQAAEEPPQTTARGVPEGVHGEGARGERAEEGPKRRGAARVAVPKKEAPMLSSEEEARRRSASLARPPSFFRGSRPRARGHVICFYEPERGEEDEKRGVCGGACSEKGRWGEKRRRKK